MTEKQIYSNSRPDYSREDFKDDYDLASKLRTSGEFSDKVGQVMRVFRGDVSFAKSMEELASFIPEGEPHGALTMIVRSRYSRADEELF